MLEPHDNRCTRRRTSTRVSLKDATTKQTMSSQPIRALLIDLSGTLHIESTPLPGAIEALQRLRTSGIPFRFCSNTSKESTSSLCQKLRRIGFDIPLEAEVWTSVGAVRQLLEDRGLKRFAEFFPPRHMIVSLILLSQAVLHLIGLCEGRVCSGLKWFHRR